MQIGDVIRVPGEERASPHVAGEAGECFEVPAREEHGVAALPVGCLRHDDAGAGLVQPSDVVLQNPRCEEGLVDGEEERGVDVLRKRGDAQTEAAAHARLPMVVAHDAHGASLDLGHDLIGVGADDDHDRIQAGRPRDIGDVRDEGLVVPREKLFGLTESCRAAGGKDDGGDFGVAWGQDGTSQAI